MSDSDDDEIPVLVSADAEEIPLLISADVPQLVSTDTSQNPPPDAADSIPQDVNEESNKVPDADLSTRNQQLTENPVPVTILTGWLGAGKTSLLRHILESLQDKGTKVAIIQNEFSDLGVENALRVEDDSGDFGEVLELGGGCVCCSVRSDMAVALTNLVSRRTFDLIVIECSGLANPGPLAGMFWVDHELESGIYLDGIISVADAKHVTGHLDGKQEHSNQVIHQIAFADVILLNKQDLVTEGELKTAQQRLRAINAVAKMVVTKHSTVPLQTILNLRAFDHVHLGETLHPAVTQTQPHSGHQHTDDHEHGEHKHEHKHEAVNDHPHDHSIASIVLEEPGLIDRKAFEKWLHAILWHDTYDNTTTSAQAPKIFRMKGVLSVSEAKNQIFLQAVEELYDLAPGDDWSSDSRISRLVIIGRYLDEAALRQGFASTVIA